MTASTRTAPIAPGSPAAVLAATPASRRLRPQRPVRALVGALVVVVAVVAALAMYTRLGNRDNVLALGATVFAGEEITAADLHVVSVSSRDPIGAVAAASRNAVVGKVAQYRLTAGSLLTPGAYGDAAVGAADTVQMSVQVRRTQLPVGLRERSRLVLVAVPAKPGRARPQVVEGLVVAIPADLVERMAGGDADALIPLVVEVDTASAEFLGTATFIAVGVVDPGTSMGSHGSRGEVVA